MKSNHNIQSVVKRHIGMLPVLMVAVIALVLAVSAPAAWAKRDVIEYDEAEIFFELNNTDEDLGIHALIDGEGWKYLKIRDPRNRKMLDVIVQGRMRKQGLTEIFFESAEPEFEELDPAVFFRRFPEGDYTITGKTLERDKLKATAEITHVMPAPPQTYVNGGEAAEDCDVPLTGVTQPVTISWDEVTMSHPDADGGGAGVQPPELITVHNYEVVVEIDETPWKISTILPPDARSFVVPEEIIAAATFEGTKEIKFEVLVREESYNQTAVESCFVLE